MQNNKRVLNNNNRRAFRKLLLLVFVLCSFSAIHAQNKKLLANGSAANLYINHKVSPKETYAAIARKYNISPVKLANYNNLDYYPGRLMAKFLKVPLTQQNFVKVEDVINAAALTPIYKKDPRGKQAVIGFLQMKKETKPVPNFAKIIKDSTSSGKKKLNNSTDTSYSSLESSPSEAISNDISSPPVTTRSAENANSAKQQLKKPKHKHYRSRPERFTEHFISFAIIILTLTSILIGTIYFYLSVKKKRFFSRERLRTDVEKMISIAMLNEKEKIGFIKPLFPLPTGIIKEMEKKEVRQIVLDEIVKGKKNFKGKAGSNLVDLYEQLGLVKDSVEKLDNSYWFIKAKGIQELAVMEQAQMLPKIYRLTNSSNENVRMEAQSAVVHFRGFKGLRFLSLVTYPISDWQQIKLIDRLSTLSYDEQHVSKKWLESKNESVVIFTLKIINVFRDLALHDEVVRCLHHPSKTVRHQAIKCLQQIYNSSTASILQQAYQNEEYKNKIAILDVLKLIGNEEQLEFLYIELFDEDDRIKIGAATALMECCVDALQLIESASFEKGQPYTTIYRQVKGRITV